jgi:hypothetical protein
MDRKVSKVRQENMVASPKGRRLKKDHAGEGQQHIQKTDPSSHQRGASQKQDCNCQTVINISRGSTQRLTDWPTISRNVTLTLSNLALFADDSAQGGLHSQKTPTWPGVTIGTLNSMKRRLGQSTSIIELDHLSLFLHWMDEHSICKLCKTSRCNSR